MKPSRLVSHNYCFNPSCCSNRISFFGNFSIKAQRFGGKAQEFPFEPPELPRIYKIKKETLHTSTAKITHKNPYSLPKSYTPLKTPLTYPYLYLCPYLYPSLSSKTKSAPPPINKATPVSLNLKPRSTNPPSPTLTPTLNVNRFYSYIPER